MANLKRGQRPSKDPNPDKSAFAAVTVEKAAKLLNFHPDMVPCIRQRPFARAEAMQGSPFLVRAPHKSL